MPWHIDIVEKIRISQGWPNRWKYAVKAVTQRVESRYYNVLLRTTRLQFTIFRLIVPAVIIAGHLVCTIALVGFHSFISNQISAAAGGAAYIAIMNAIHLLIHHVTRGSKTLARQQVLACATLDVGASFTSRFIAAIVFDEWIAADSRVKTQSDKIVTDNKEILYCQKIVIRLHHHTILHRYCSSIF